MSHRDADTLPHQDSQLRPPASPPGTLILALEYQRPAAGSLGVPLDEVDEIVIGRGEERTLLPGSTGRVRHLLVGDPFMSRAHAKVARSGGRWAVIDLDSKNGILVNGTPTRRAALTDGDSIEIGHSMFWFKETHNPVPALRLPELSTLHQPLADQLDELERIAPLAIPIILLGETGTGKEVLARAVHERSRRRGAFVAVNCASIPPTLIESELFGHRRGAFSGAHEDRLGLIRSADGGTLFLDEIGELPAPAQAALLRVLQDQMVTPVGEVRATRVDFRVIAATNRDLPTLVAGAGFRSDLYARLSGLVLRLPPLRERYEDLGALIAALLHELAPGVTLSFTKTAARALFRHPWPFNIRELEKCLATAVALTDDGVIDLCHLKSIASATPNTTSPSSPTPPPSSSPTLPPTPLAEGTYSTEEMRRRNQLTELLELHRGNVAAVARDLGKAPVQVYRWMQRYGIRPDDFRD